MAESATIRRIRLGMTSAYVISTGNGAILVDAGKPGDGPRIEHALRAMGVDPGDLEIILITHGHTDHFGAARALHERYGVPVAIHEADADALRRGANSVEGVAPTSRQGAMLMGLAGKMASGGADATAVALDPHRTFSEVWRLEEFGIPAEVIPCPGHTPGASVVMLDDGRVVAGDIISGRWLAIAGPPGAPIVATNLHENWRAVELLLENGAKRFYVGHGGPFSAEQVRRYLQRHAERA